VRNLVGELGSQLRWARAAAVPAIPPASEILVVGMGGSGISGDYLAALAAPGGRRVSVAKGYRLPGWATASRPLVLAVSYSGDTEVTLAAVAAADAAALAVVTVSTGGRLATWAEDRGHVHVPVPGGRQPRAALGHLFGTAVRIAAAAGVLAGADDALAEAADVADLLAAGPGWSIAADLAAGLERRAVAVYAGEGLAAAAGGRWKTQLNENAKVPAWTSTIPELDHNEIEAWTGEPDLGARRVGIVALRDRDEPPGVARRFAHTRRAVDGTVQWAGEAWSVGESPLARLVSLTVVGDMVSVELAERAGVDPLRVDVIESFKRTIKEEQ